MIIREDSSMGSWAAVAVEFGKWTATCGVRIGRSVGFCTTLLADLQSMSTLRFHSAPIRLDRLSHIAAEAQNILSLCIDIVPAGDRSARSEYIRAAQHVSIHGWQAHGCHWSPI